jgi:hypothetical protein
MCFVKNILILATCALSALPLNVSADEGSRNKEIAERFAKCDTNRDGKLTINEAKGCMPRIYDHFSSIDTANKGYVTVVQIQTMASR